MQRLASVLFLLVSCCVNCAVFGAEPLVIDLWPGKTPGDVGITDQEKSLIYQSPILGGPTKLVTNVSKPTLTIFQPAPDKNVGTAMLICPAAGITACFGSWKARKWRPG